MPERIPLFKIEMFVDEHLTKEPADSGKPDVFTVTLKSFGKEFKVGLDDAKAKLAIKAFDDVVKQRLPKLHAFTVEIYPKTKSVVVERPRSEPTTL